MTGQRKSIAAADIEWEEPPRNRRPANEEVEQLVELVKAMVPALREKLDSWGVVDVFDGPKTAANRGALLKRRFGTLDTIEARLEFFGTKIKEEPEKSKLYVRLRPVK